MRAEKCPRIEPILRDRGGTARRRGTQSWIVRPGFSVGKRIKSSKAHPCSHHRARTRVRSIESKHETNPPFERWRVNGARCQQNWRCDHKRLHTAKQPLSEPRESDQASCTIARSVQAVGPWSALPVGGNARSSTQWIRGVHRLACYLIGFDKPPTTPARTISKYPFTKGLPCPRAVREWTRLRQIGDK